MGLFTKTYIYDKMSILRNHLRGGVKCVVRSEKDFLEKRPKFRKKTTIVCARKFYGLDMTDTSLMRLSMAMPFFHHAQIVYSQARSTNGR